MVIDLKLCCLRGSVDKACGKTVFFVVVVVVVFVLFLLLFVCFVFCFSVAPGVVYCLIYLWWEVDLLKMMTSMKCLCVCVRASSCTHVFLWMLQRMLRKKNKNRKFQTIHISHTSFQSFLLHNQTLQMLELLHVTYDRIIAEVLALSWPCSLE